MKTRASSMMEGAVCSMCAMCAMCVLAGAWLLAAAPRAQTQATQGEAQKPTTADVSLGQALHQEQNEGRLEDAIATYKKVLAAVDATRAQKARAQFRIGACYERLGLSEARKAYEIVVSEYGDQNEFAAQARARLGAISALATGAAPQKTPGGPTTRLLWSKPGWTSADLSPDGRSVAFIDEASMCLWIRDIATGADRQLTTTTKDEPWSYASYAIWSPDASRIAYSWYKLDGASGTAEIRVVDLKSGAIATFPRSRAATSAEPSDWSPDGRRVLVVVGSEKLAWLNTADGMVSPLAGIRAPQLRAARLSPDGLTIVFGAAAGDGRTDGDIFIGPADGSTTSVLLGGPGDEYPVAWTPDGARLLVRGQRSGSSGFWLLRVEKGKAVGDPEFLPGVGTARFQGLSRAGAMLYSTGVSQTDLRVAAIDLRTGHTGPSDVLGVLPGSVPAAMGGWSKDGAHLAYLATVGERIMVVVAAGDGSTPRALSIPFTTLTSMPLTWAPDSRALMVAGSTDKSHASVYRTDIETGAATTLMTPVSPVDPDGDTSTRWAASWDGRTIYMQKYHQASQKFSLWTHDVQSSAEAEVYRSDKPAAFMGGTLSPDGTLLAFVPHVFAGNKGRQLLVLPVSGGPPRPLCDYPPYGAPRLMAWAPDGRSLLFGQASGESDDALTEIWQVGAEGGQPRKLDIAHPRVEGLAVHPDGTRIAYISRTRTNHEVWLLENFLPAKVGTATPAGTAPHAR